MDRLRINGSVARRALVELEGKGLIKKVCADAGTPIYTRTSAAAAIAVEKAAVVEKPVKGKAAKVAAA